MDIGQATSESPKQKHSGWGIASLVIAISAGLAIVLGLLTAGILQATTPGGADTSKPIIILLGCILIVAAVALLLGLVFGILGVLEKDRNTLFSKLGVIFNAVLLFAFVCIEVWGFYIKYSGH